MSKNREIYVLQWGTPAKLDYQVEEKDRETVDSWGSLYNRAKTFLKSPQIVPKILRIFEVYHPL